MGGEERSFIETLRGIQVYKKDLFRVETKVLRDSKTPLGRRKKKRRREGDQVHASGKKERDRMNQVKKTRI